MHSSSNLRKQQNTQSLTIQPFSYKVPTELFFRHKDKPQKQQFIDKQYEIYNNLKDLRDNNQLLSPLRQQPQTTKQKTRTINVVEQKKQRTLKKMRDQLFQQKKKRLLLENKIRMEQDIKNLEKLSVSAFHEFKDQLNLYNKYYSTYIGKELQLKEVHKEDLRIVSAVATQKDQSSKRFTYKEILNYTNPTINYDNETVQAEKKEINQYIVTEEMLEVEELTKLKQTVSLRSLKDRELEFLHFVKLNDLDTIKFMLVNHKNEVLNAQDCAGQTALHWAAKRNFYEICWELVNQKIDIFKQDCACRTAKDLAEKFQHYKIAKFLQNEEDAQLKKRFIKQ